MSDSQHPPETDPRAAYDYQSETVRRAGLVDDLEARVDGDVRFDEYSRQLYATDASAYEVTPIGVVYPTSTDDVAAVMSYCARREIPVLPRGGGTSLAGQSVNEAVVLDFTRHMDGLLGVDPDAETARVQAGAIVDELGAALEPHGLKFAPDPAAGNRSAVGGAIGNNSTGAHSLKYGKTDAYVREAEVVLADGTVTTLGEVSLDELRENADPDGDAKARIYAAVADIVDQRSDAVREVFPQLKRNVSGYNLDRLLDEAEGGSVNLARLLAGSEGTLAIITEATVDLEPIPETKSMALLTYEDLLDAMEDVAPILDHDPAAVEVLDGVLLDLARETEEFGDLVEMLPDGTRAVLLVEFYAETDADGKEAVADLLADRVPDAESEVAPADGAATITNDPQQAFAAREAHEPAARKQFWKLRKSGLPILLSRTSDAKHISFIEDTAVPPENLPEYIADVQQVLEEHDTFASFYAHAGPGCLHIRPLIDTKSPAGVDRMESLADAITDLVVEYGGSVSGEHGDGRARTQWNHKLYGEEVWQVFRDLKSAFDPDWLLNPGQVCGLSPERVDSTGDSDADATLPDMTENLRFDPTYEFDAGFEPTLDWSNDNGFQGMAELCHGCGGCRGQQDTTGGVMCPTYRAADEEITSTRGRANALRQAMSGELPDDEVFSDEFVTEVLDLCIGCKGCARDCPSEVDMAKMKAELTHEYHQREGSSLRDRLFANVETAAKLGSATAPLSNLATKLPGAGVLAEKLLGIARERELPTFQRRSFVDRMDDRTPSVGVAEAERKALVFPDTYTNYSDPEIGMAAVRVLEAAGVHVAVPTEVTGSGRPPFSKGFLDLARERARHNVAELAPLVADGWDVVVVEPSDAVMLQSDYRDLLTGEAVDRVAGNTFGVLEYLDLFDLDPSIDADGEAVTYHGHCHQKASKRDMHAPAVLDRAGYDVDVLDSGCCGMAGSFGYEEEHYSMSRSIGSILFDQIDESGGETVTAPGTSCRSQLAERDGNAEKPAHPVELLDRTL
ncbi:FAD/FMN-containing dehydrogenase [Natronoarchaeum philippinense]|uniref:D-lactate dehydrogenase (cytochrome) n=1 Tax=Natronoarchaeum philippinense TaxID=558529 RepID=A0A285N6E9_NATPI|nr:FAD-binding and (Fe-S)-binding domain-containing protein [Natronoarchaeum philippinense]SNZ05032.1 FAD/FMN-containing dehydrogenase [Natronoarchaeum philippinense]